MVEHKKIKKINEYKVGDSVDDLFAVRLKHPPSKARNDKYYFSLNLQDSSGNIAMKYWGGFSEDNVQSIYESILEDSIVYIKGRISEYNGKKDISVNENDLEVLLEGEYDISDFIPISKLDKEKMYSDLKIIIDSIQGEYKQVLDSFFQDSEFVEKFKHSPAAFHKHHGHISGLLEHTLIVTSICQDVLKFYPEFNRDLTLTGAILHDIGKIKEFEFSSVIKVGDQGNLLSHIAIGVIMLNDKLKDLDVSEITKNKLLHIIVSHHRQEEWGSPKKPSFPEAMLIHKVDDLNACVTEISNLKENADTEGNNFAYHKDYGNIYLR